eukprot:gene24999-10866_t
MARISMKFELSVTDSSNFMLIQSIKCLCVGELV